MDNFYYLGSEIKSVDGKIKGYAIRFGNENDTDLESDYFSSNTDFGRPLKIGDSFKMNVYYHHGQDKTLKSMVIGEGIVEMTDKGLWFEAQLDLANEYAIMIDKLVKEGKMGYSSGSASHLVTRVQKSNSYEIKSWPIAEISITPQPAESRNKVFKSLDEFIKGIFNKQICPDCAASMTPDNMCMCNPKKQLCKMCNKPSAKDVCEECGMEMDFEEPMEETEIDVNLDPQSYVDEVFMDYSSELVSEAIHELYEKMCSGLYAVLEGGKPYSYIEGLIDGFASRAKDVANKIYDAPAAEMASLKKYNGSKPETVRDLEKRLRDVIGLSNNQAKALAGMVFNQRDVDEDTNLNETKSIEQETVIDNELKNKMIKQALLDLMR